jgi:hypothetical protein
MHSRKLIVWSNLAFVLPLGVAIYFRVWPSAIVLGAVIVASFAYHFSEEKKLRRIDPFFAWLLILSNLWICYLGNFASPYFEIALLFVVVALCFYLLVQKRNEILMHSFWHFFSALITVFSILTFIKG